MKIGGAILVLCLLISTPHAFRWLCQHDTGSNGCLGGAAVRAIGGQLIRGTTNATLIGAGVGALGGALVNDALHKDKKK